MAGETRSLPPELETDYDHRAVKGNSEIVQISPTTPCMRSFASSLEGPRPPLGRWHPAQQTQLNKSTYRNDSNS